MLNAMNNLAAVLCRQGPFKNAAETNQQSLKQKKIRVLFHRRSKHKSAEKLYGQISRLREREAMLNRRSRL